MARVNRAGLAEVRRTILTPLALKGAQAASEVLREKLGQAGSGQQWPGLPRPSSAVGEYPARQTGELQESIDAREAREMRAEFGAIQNPPDYAAALHFKPPDDGGRPFMDFALHDEEVHDAVRKATGAK